MIAQTEIGSGPALAEDTPNGRFYHWGQRIIGKPDIEARTEDYPSVTTLLSVLDKPALRAWYANTVTQYAMQTVDRWQPKIDTNLDEIETWQPKHLKANHPTVFGIYDQLRKRPETIRDQRGHRGSAVHEILDLAYGQGMPLGDAYEKVVGSTAYHGLKNEIKDDVTRPVVKYFQENVIEMIASEGTVYNTRHLYAGSFDAMVRLKDGRVAILDYKTARNTYHTNGLQLVAYSMCDKIAVPLRFSDPRRKKHIEENSLASGTVVVELKDMPVADLGIVAHIPGDQKGEFIEVEFTKKKEQAVIGLRVNWEVAEAAKRGGWYVKKTRVDTRGQDL